MSNVLDDFITKKKAESPFISLEDGESVTVKLRELKMLTKTGYAGEEKEVLRLVVDVDTSEGIRVKNFDNGTQKFANALKEKEVVIGSVFTITREGELTKTVYHISDVKNPQPAA